MDDSSEHKTSHSFVGRMNKFLAKTWRGFKKMNWPAKVVLCFYVLLLCGLLFAFITIGPKKIFQTMYDLGQKIKNMRFGWLILFAIAIATSFPPVIGSGTTLSLAGFAYGPIYGIFVALPASIIGSSIAFVTLRLLFKNRISSWTRRNKKWQAMEQVIEAKGMLLIVLIRLCPIPWVYSNTLFASIEVVSLWQFVIATCCLLPKMWVIVYIGSQLANLSDGTTRESMSTTAKILNILSIVISIMIAIGTGWLVWRLTQEKIKHIESLSAEVDEEAVDALDDATRPLLVPGLSGDDDEEEPAALEVVVNDLIGTGSRTQSPPRDSGQSLI